jgi:hypothetical protein
VPQPLEGLFATTATSPRQAHNAQDYLGVHRDRQFLPSPVTKQQIRLLAVEHINTHIFVMSNNIKMPTARDIYPVSPGPRKPQRGMPNASDLYPFGPQPMSWFGIVLLAPVFGLMAFGLVWAIGMLAII